MQTYEEWLDQLDLDPLGRLWLLKFHYDLKNGNIPENFEQTLKTVVDPKLPAPADTALQILEAVIVENPKSFDLVGLRIPPNGTQYNLVVKLEVFSYKYLNPGVLTKVDEGEDEYDYVWKELGNTITAKDHFGWVRTAREFFWCAPKGTIKKILTTCNSRCNLAATTVRNRLGLDHMAKGQRLILIDVPNTALAGRKLCAPTCLDSGLNPVFVPFNDPRGYGRTFNLRTGSRDVREVVVEKIPFDPTFGSQKLGKVGAKVPSVSYTVIESLIK